VNEHEKIRIIPKTFFHTLLLYDERNLITVIGLTRLQRGSLASPAGRREFQIISAPVLAGFVGGGTRKKTRRSRFQRRAARFTAACASTA